QSKCDGISHNTGDSFHENPIAVVCSSRVVNLVWPESNRASAGRSRIAWRISTNINLSPIPYLVSNTPSLIIPQLMTFKRQLYFTLMYNSVKGNFTGF